MTDRLSQAAMDALLGNSNNKPRNNATHNNNNNSLPGSSLKLWRPEKRSMEQEQRKKPRHEEPSKPESKPESSSSSSSEDIKNKELPNFKPSGKLQAAAMEENGVTLKYAEPPSARMAPKGWRLYEFKGEEQLETIRLDGKSLFRIGRDERVCPLTMLHNSISSQHAVIQFREVERKNRFDDETGAPVREVVPAIIDLKSTNGTKLNGTRIQDSIYIELKQQDVLQFGDSTREYVVIHE